MQNYGNTEQTMKYRQRENEADGKQKLSLDGETDIQVLHLLLVLGKFLGRLPDMDQSKQESNGLVQFKEGCNTGPHATTFS